MGSFNNNQGISEIFKNYKPAFNNLYTIEIYPTSSDTPDSSINDYFKFHAVSVDFGGESLNMERNKATRTFHLSESNPYTLQDNLTITWREDENYRVRKYHDDWLNLFYDRSTDKFRSYTIDQNRTNTNKLYRDFVITLPGKEHNQIKFVKVLPSNNGNLNLAWGNSPSIIKHQMTYYPESYTWNTKTGGDN